MSTHSIIDQFQNPRNEHFHEVEVSTLENSIGCQIDITCLGNIDTFELSWDEMLNTDHLSEMFSYYTVREFKFIVESLGTLYNLYRLSKS